MKPTYLVSSNICCTTWSKGKLYVKFTSGQNYSYDKVSYPLYRDFIAADSPGHFFHCHIRQAFKYEKLTSDPFTVQARAPVKTLQAAQIHAAAQ